ncbi:MAG: 4-(cytidine 5'-diphospho)-2-C-methyl-D-erythritol kinase [Bacteroidota bacterium]
MNFIQINSPAKINIGLNIVSKRDDGFHNLETLFYPLEFLHDTITFKKSEKFSFVCSKPELQDSSNLIVKAVKLLEQKTEKRFNVDIYLQKNIPVGGGLGGGSSNAAAALFAINELFQLNLTYEKLQELSLQLGSDVPFFIKAKPAIGKSRGEILTQVNFSIHFPILIINPGIHISTNEAFKNIVPKINTIKYEQIEFNNANEIKSWQGLIRNDFEECIFSKYKEIGRIKNILLENGALFSKMTGTGSTVFGIYENLSDAERIKKLFPESYFRFINHHAEG